jgi:hypothetical protein
MQQLSQVKMFKFHIKIHSKKVKGQIILMEQTIIKMY